METFWSLNHLLDRDPMGMSKNPIIPIVGRNAHQGAIMVLAHIGGQIHRNLLSCQRVDSFQSGVHSSLVI